MKKIRILVYTGEQEIIGSKDNKNDNNILINKSKKQIDKEPLNEEKNIINETKSESIINKKGVDELINEESKLNEEESKAITINKNIKNKIKKVIFYRNPLKIYFNKWRYLMDFEEAEIFEEGIKKKIPN